ncbi:MAG: site-specific integrase [Acidobacteria bacterium]|nr:site-specific integrase [Acidobacteriota bacterium]
MPKPPDIDDILHAVRDGRRQDYKLKMPSGYELQVDGADDHALARDMFSHLESIGKFSELTRVPPTEPPVLTGISFADAVEKWKKILPGKNSLIKTQNAKKRAVAVFSAWLQSTPALGGTVALAAITREHLGELYAHCVSAGKVSEFTIENYFTYLIGFFEWAVTAGHYPKGDNPAEGHANVSKKKKRLRALSSGWQSYTPQQITAIFEPSAYAEMKDEAARWIPLLLLYTGARSNEIGRLELADCREEDGIPVFAFSLVGDDKSLKNEHGERLTPVHPDLIALGLWDRVSWLLAKGETKLFPDANFETQNGPAAAAQRAFTRHLERLKISARGKGRMGHHSFRDTVIQQLDDAEVPQPLFDYYTGHGDNSVVRAAYQREKTPGRLAKWCHPHLSFGLDISGLRKLLR